MRPVRMVLRWLGLVSLALVTASCSGPGIDAGEDGGVAFIALFGMLVVGVFLFWFFLGRDE